jgi:hypothetical protein
MLGEPCIMNCVYNNQLDALFILRLLIKVPLRVTGINSPSSGGKVYVCSKWYF